MPPGAVHPDIEPVRVPPLIEVVSLAELIDPVSDDVRQPLVPHEQNASVLRRGHRSPRRRPMVPRIMQEPEVIPIIGDQDPPELSRREELHVVLRLWAEVDGMDDVVSMGAKERDGRNRDALIEIELSHVGEGAWETLRRTQ